MAERIILGITGASGIPIATRLAEELANEFELVTVVTDAAKEVMKVETESARKTLQQLKDVSTVFYGKDNMAASIASGSNKNIGMVVAPCSMKTLGSIANGISDTLVTRAADVCLKERRKLVLVTRETPLNSIHLTNMTKLSDMGVDILPPVLGFYYQPETVDDIINHVVGKVLERFDVEHDLYDRWEGR